MTMTHAVVFHTTELNPKNKAGGKNFVNNNYVYPALIVLHEFILFGQFVCKSVWRFCSKVNLYLRMSPYIILLPVCHSHAFYLLTGIELHFNMFVYNASLMLAKTPLLVYSGAL